MKYREHRGGLADSLKTEKHFHTPIEFACYLEKTYQQNINEFKFEFKGYDYRLKQKTYYVLVKFRGAQNFVVVGVSDSALQKPLTEQEWQSKKLNQLFDLFE